MARPKLVIDEALVQSLAEIQCTHEEIAHVVGCSVDTLARRGFAELINKARETGRSSLRRQQWHTAMNGNPTMQIWLGKQYLGQQDKSSVETTHKPYRSAVDEVRRDLRLVG